MCYNTAKDKMGKLISHDKQAEVEKGNWLKKKFIPLLTLLLVLAISIGIFYFYKHYTIRVEELKAYLYWAPFLISLVLNATVILPAGNIVIISALGAALPSATVVGLASGAGAAIGEITSYMAGYSGRGIVEKRKMYARIEGWVRRWGAVVIFIFSLVPFVFDLAGIAAGVLRFPFWKFFLLCWLGRTLLYIGVALAGAWGWETMLRYLG